MADQVVPSTNDVVVAEYALAWEIVRLCQFKRDEDPDVTKRMLTNAVIEVFRALHNEEKITKTNP